MVAQFRDVSAFLAEISSTVSNQLGTDSRFVGYPETNLRVEFVARHRKFNSLLFVQNCRSNLPLYASRHTNPTRSD